MTGRAAWSCRRGYGRPGRGRADPPGATGQCQHAAPAADGELHGSVVESGDVVATLVRNTDDNCGYTCLDAQRCWQRLVLAPVGRSCSGGAGVVCVAELVVQ
ncbi:MAG: FxLD family lanthipeptide [Pseudonocardia sp.]